MAADILLYGATAVPVGDDQRQHLELARRIAANFNNRYDVEMFTPPEPIFPQSSQARVMSLRDGSSKMSKSDRSDGGRINLTDDDDTIARKVRRAQTDSVASISYDPESRPAVSNLVGIFAAVSGRSVDAVVEE